MSIYLSFYFFVFSSFLFPLTFFQYITDASSALVQRSSKLLHSSQTIENGHSSRQRVTRVKSVTQPDISVSSTEELVVIDAMHLLSATLESGGDVTKTFSLWTANVRKVIENCLVRMPVHELSESVVQSFLQICER
jgi:hypothetical protein